MATVKCVHEVTAEIFLHSLEFLASG
jgi:hypothetical protein